MTSDTPASHELFIGTTRHDIRVDGQAVELGATEFRILQLLASSPEEAFSRIKILDGIHGDLYAITPRAVDGQIVNLRKKLGEAAVCIETVRGVGYRFHTADGLDFLHATTSD
jgi:DNA-binding response OmpR family regulator